MVDTLELIEIDTADTIEELYEKEIGYIREYNSYYINENGYNMTYGGEGANGYVFTEEVKQKMSESRKKHFEDNPEAGKEQGERLKKHYENPEARQKCSEAQKKRFENPEEREQQSELKKKHFENPEAIQKCSEAQKKRFENPEARQKCSEARKKYLEKNPDERRKLLDIKGKNKPFDVFTKDGIFIKTFTYQIEAKEYLQTEYKITSTFKISEVLAGKRNNSAGFIFKYK
jgi:hypothetical protein